MSYERAPRLLFWESTKACPLVCRHCRAAAQHTAAAGELDTRAAEGLLDQAAAFDPPPIIVITGGDPLSRADLPHLLQVAQRLGLTVALAPAVSDALNIDRLQELQALGARSLSISIDALQPTHDAIRGIAGTFQRSLAILNAAHSLGLAVQVNTVVMRDTVDALPSMVKLLLQHQVRTWEVFFLIPTGRAQADAALPADQLEEVCRFLIEATSYGLVVRTVEAPFIRRLWSSWSTLPAPSQRLLGWRRELLDGLGPPTQRPHLARRGTLDGDGILFVGHDGVVTPGGFLPLPLGRIQNEPLAAIYQNHRLLRAIRTRRLHGACGACRWRDLCGGSRARAYAVTGDPLASDPGCVLAVAET